MTGETMYAPTVKEVESSEQYGRFTIEPLEPGFGTTLGNSLRRVLLSSLPGAAVTAVSIDGVAHEFSAVPYVKEDVTEILLNVKGLHVISHSDEPVRLSLEVKGERVVTAGDIEANSLVEICNPDMYICALSGKDATLRKVAVVHELPCLISGGGESKSIHDIVETTLQFLEKHCASHTLAALSPVNVDAELSLKNTVQPPGTLLGAQLYAVVAHLSP